MTAFHAVVLAAGAGARFGGSKLTAPWHGGVLLDGALAAACAAPVAGVVVVVGAHEAVVCAAVAAFVAPESRPLAVVRCADHARGMSASLRTGLRALPADAAGALIFLGDMPVVPHGVAAQLVDAVRSGSLAAVPSIAGRQGHPIAIAARAFDAFCAVAGDRGGRSVLDRLSAEVAVIAVDDPGILTDIDARADLRALR